MSNGPETRHHLQITFLLSLFDCRFNPSDLICDIWWTFQTLAASQLPSSSWQIMYKYLKKKQNHPAGTNNSWATYSCYQNTTSLIQLVDVAWLAFQRQRSGGNQSSRDRVRACPWSRELLASKAEDAVEMPGNDGKPAVYVGFHWANHLIIRKRALPLPALSTKSGAPSDSGSANSSRDEWLV